MIKNLLRICLCLLLFTTIFSCQRKVKVDMIIHHANIYTVNSKFDKAEAFAIKDGLFVDVGSNDRILNLYDSENKIDLKGKAVFPGFSDAHCHFYGYGTTLQTADLLKTKSYDEVLERLVAFQKKNPEKAWLMGRGWDQNDWTIKEFPTKEKLDSLFPNTPVFLMRVDGHAALVNQKALDYAKNDLDKKISGGDVIQEDGEPTGILVDNAIDLVRNYIPVSSTEEIQKTLLDAQERCLAVGLTSLDEAGLNKDVIDAIEMLYKQGKLKLRINVMLSSNQQTLDYYLKKGVYTSDRLRIGAVKIYGDGALGSRGACLLQPYHDRPNQKGFLLIRPDSLKTLLKRVYDSGFQANTHCIGDSANRLVLDSYGELLKENNDRRWRIEHAQVVDPLDFPKFKKFKVIPSVQPTHATSDMYWAADRLGKERVKNAYAFKTLLDQNGFIALGSDFPVEDINPLYGFHAATARQDQNDYPNEGFQKENALSRQDALRGMTIWAAFSNFQERTLGSIERGKKADFVVLEKDIMATETTQVYGTKVLATFIHGEKVYGSTTIKE
jgi:predicted amidohydrolase YtcJ